MATRTIPTKFPNMGVSEGYGMMPFSASLMRRLALSQNYLYANARRVYANHAYEGVGRQLGVFNANYVPFESVNLPTVAGAHPLSPGLPVASFFVPRNWGGGSRVEVNGRSDLTMVSATNEAQIWAVLYNLDETPTGVANAVGFKGGGHSNYDWSIILRVPQDKEYQIKIFLCYAKNGGGDGWSSNSIKTSFVSARYMQADAIDLGYTPPTSFFPMYPTAALSANDSGNAIYLTNLIKNAGYLWSEAGPELCQSYYAQAWNNTTSFVEVGRYVFRWGGAVSSIVGKLYCYLTNGGAGCEVRVLLNGTVKQTFTAIASGYQTLTIAAITTGYTPGAKNTLTIEAKNSSSASWGTIVWGVHVWEDSVAAQFKTETPSAYQPLDEFMLRGDKPVVWKDDSAGRREGLWYLVRNDLWLAQHRSFRGLIGDFRHYVLKRAGVFSATTDVDGRADWTRGDVPLAYQIPGEKNISIRGTAATDGQIPLGNYSNGVETGSGWNGVPFVFPSVGTSLQQGWTLGRYICETPSGVQTHQSLGAAAAWRASIRGRRARPALMATDTNGTGPQPEESPYRNKGYFEISYNGTAQSMLSRIVNHGTREDYERQWHGPIVGLHTAAAVEVRLRGRLPPQLSGGYGNVSGVTRPEGALFEVELNSVFMADESISETYLNSLP